jgi:hypothetical protein
VKDKRKHQRIQFLRKVVVLSNDERILLDVLDYSMGGMSVFSKTAYMVGELLYLESLTTLDGEDKPLGLQAEVRHVENHDSSGFVIGMEFKK